jgi:gamma-glutamylcyclotransferase (GGCT)/AIG2-like uncharacterized protein YtfP
MNIYLFTYGMLTNRKIMDSKAWLIGAGTLNDWSFEMLNYANVYKNPGHSCQGVLWQIDSDILRDCDYREGYPVMYDREIVEVRSQGKSYMSWVYTLTDESRRDYKTRRASANYCQAVSEGYQQHGVNLDQIADVMRSIPMI